MLGHPLAPVRVMATTMMARAIGIVRTGMSAAIDMNAVNGMSEEVGIEAIRGTKVTGMAVDTGAVMGDMMIDAG